MWNQDNISIVTWNYWEGQYTFWFYVMMTQIQTKCLLYAHPFFMYFLALRVKMLRESSLLFSPLVEKTRLQA